MDDAPLPAARYQTASGAIPAGSGSPMQVLGADPRRRTLLVANSVSNGNQGFYLGTPDTKGFHFAVTGTFPVQFTWAEHGDIVFLPLWIDGQFPTGISSYITLVEV